VIDTNAYLLNTLLQKIQTLFKLFPKDGGSLQICSEKYRVKTIDTVGPQSLNQVYSPTAREDTKTK